MWLTPTPLRPRFEAALRDIASKKPLFRRMAAEALGSPPEGQSTRAHTALLALAEDAVAEVRAAAFRSLGELASEAVDTLSAGLDDEDVRVREAAVGALGASASPRALPAVRRALASPHPEVRFVAVDAMAHLDPESAPLALGHLVGDPDPHVRMQLATTLGSLPGAEATSALRSLLQDEDAPARYAAALSLGHVGAEEAAPVLRAALRDPAYQLEAADVLGRLGDREALPLLRALAHGFFVHPLVRASVAGALARLGDARGIPILRRLLRGLRSDARSYTVELAGELGLVELAPELVALARRPRGADPVAVVEALVALAASSALATQALRDIALGSGDAADRARSALAPN